MRLFHISGAAIALLAVSSFAALADDATGTVTKIEPGSVTLDSGQVFSLAIDLTPTIKVGQKVSVAFANVNGTLMASGVMPILDNGPGSIQGAAKGESALTPKAGSPQGAIPPVD